MLGRGLHQKRKERGAKNMTARFKRPAESAGTFQAKAVKYPENCHCQRAVDQEREE